MEEPLSVPGNCMTSGTLQDVIFLIPSLNKLGYKGYK